MATNTGILDLVKPAGNENALISVINSNMDKLDAEAGRSRGNIAANYSTSSAYDVGDLCIYQGNLYRCNTAIASGEEWTAAHWTQVNIAGELDSQKQAIANLGNNIGTLSSLKTSAKTSAVDAINEVLGLAQCRRMYISANGSIDIAVPDSREIYFFVCPSTGEYYLGAVNGNSNTITKIAGSATASKLTATRGSYKITLTSSQTWGMLVYVLAPFSTTGGV